MPAVVDYSVARPAPLTILANGYLGAMRYLGTDSRCLTQPELIALHTAGLAVGLIWETSADRAASGYQGGKYDAQTANGLADALGAPEWLPIFMAVDFEPTAAQLNGSVSDYFRVAQSESRRPVRPYGSYAVQEHLCGALGLFPCGWQCVAWSYGQRSRFACLYQRLGYVLGNTSDHNDVLMDPQQFLWSTKWGAPSIPAAPTPVQEDDMAAVQVKFTDGATYVMVPCDRSPTTFAWSWIPGPVVLTDAELNGIVSGRQVTLGTGNDALDAMFKRHPILPVAGDPHFDAEKDSHPALVG